MRRKLILLSLACKQNTFAVSIGDASSVKASEPKKQIVSCPDRIIVVRPRQEPEVPCVVYKSSPLVAPRASFSNHETVACGGERWAGKIEGQSGVFEVPRPIRQPHQSLSIRPVPSKTQSR